MIHHRSSAILLSSLILYAVVGVAPRMLYAQDQVTLISVADYLAELQNIASGLKADPTIAGVEHAQQRLISIEEVTLPDGTVVKVEPLLGEDKVTLPTNTVAQLRLSVVIAQLQATPTDQMAARLALLETIFARTEFVGRDSLWDRFWRWLRSFLPDSAVDDASSNPTLVTAGITILGWVVLGVGALLVVYLLSFWLQNLLGSFVHGEQQARRASATDEPGNAAEARQQAHQLAAGGSFREAVRRMYLSALLTLDEQALLHYERSSTNREVLSTVQANPTLHKKLRPIVEIFDDVWYGIHEPDRATFDHYMHAVEQLGTDVEPAEGDSPVHSASMQSKRSQL